MSFTTQVKEEILNLDSADKNELSAIIKMSGSLGLADKKLSLSIITENAKIARHIYALLERLYRINPEIKYHHKTNLRKNRVYTVFLDDNVEQILADLQLSDSFFGIETGIEQQILSDDNAGRSYLKGAFLSTGSIRDPESGKYQLEIFSVYLDHAEDLAKLMQKFMLDTKVIEHKHGAVTYLQDIMDFLIIIGSMEGMEAFENIKVMRETRNDVNRTSNAETANIAKTINASIKTINNINKIKETVGLESLPIELQQIAQIRAAHPDFSIQQIADSLAVPLTKSGVNHRLRKINKIAEDL